MIDLKQLCFSSLMWTLLLKTIATRWLITIQELSKRPHTIASLPVYIFIFPHCVPYQPQPGKSGFCFSWRQRAPVFLHNNTTLCFIFTLHSESCIPTSSAHSGSAKTHWNSTHWLTTLSVIRYTWRSPAVFWPHWQQISALMKSRGALLCLDTLLQVLRLYQSQFQQ